MVEPLNNLIGLPDLIPTLKVPDTLPIAHRVEALLEELHLLLQQDPNQYYLGVQLHTIFNDNILSLLWHPSLLPSPNL